MNYEEFEARAKSAFDDCSEMKRMLWNMQTVVGAVPDMVRKNERLDRERAELKAELDDWKGNAEGFEPDAYMRLPLDADGLPIRLDDTVWYVGSDVVIPKDYPLKVTGFVRMHGVPGTFIETREYPAAVIKPKWLSHRAPEPPDSWEKLEEDAMKTACNYALAPRDEDGLTTCEGCRFQEHESCHHEMTLDVFKRAKKLAGIEEEQR